MMRGSFVSLGLIGVLALTACAQVPGVKSVVAEKKMSLMQAVLDKTKDGAVGYWKIDDQNYGLVTLDSTVKNGATLCRLTRENEVVDGRSSHLVASYCREGKGPWR